MSNIEVLSNGRITLKNDKLKIIEGDSEEYQILVNCANKVKNLDGATIEFGVRLGLSSILIMNENVNKIHISVDPYGSIEYSDDKHGTFKTDYSNNLRNRCLYAIYKWVYENNANLLFFILEDTEFFARFEHGIPIYNNNKKILTEYSLVHFDGPHTTEAVNKELDFFIDKRMQIGGIMVFDDIDLYNHDLIEKRIIDTQNYEIFQKGKRKAAYIKIK